MSIGRTYWRPRTGGGIRPTTRIGRWAVGTAVASVVLLFAWRLMGPLGGFPGLVLGTVGGVLALVAIVRGHDRGLAVYAAVVPLANALLMVVGELLVSH